MASSLFIDNESLGSLAKAIHEKATLTTSIDGVRLCLPDSKTEITVAPFTVIAQARVNGMVYDINSLTIADKGITVMFRVR